MDKNNKDGFSYTYSAKEQEELKRIREKYIPRTESENKMERLRRLDEGVTKKALTVSLVVGILGTLILGVGLSFIMTTLGEMLLSSHDHLVMPIGILIGIVGGALAALAYPIYNFTVTRERKKIAPEILRLTDELMK